MKRFLISILLALIAGAVFPAVSLAAGSVSIFGSGTITGISDSNEFPAGKSGRVIVIDRDILGVFTSGDITGDFTMTYRANVDLATQAGNLSGTLNIGRYLFKVEGKTDPVEWLPVAGGYIGKLTVRGNWALLSDKQGQGNFEADIIFIPTPEGHVASIVHGSSFTLTGQWQLR